MKSSTKKPQTSKPSKITYLLWVSATGLLSSLISLMLPLTIIPVLTNDCGGLDFGCAIGGVFSGLLFGLVAAVAVSGTILYRGRLHQPISVSFLTFIPSYVAFYSLGNFQYIFEENTFILYTFIVSVIFITFIIQNLILVRLSHWYFRLMVVILLCVIYIWPVMSFVNRLSYDKYQNDIDIAGRNADFDLYLPAPSILGKPVTSSSYYPQFESNQASYYEINYGLRSGSISLYQFKVPQKFNPPAECGNERPLGITGRANPCVEIGKSILGCTVYAAKPRGTNSYETYCQLGETLLTTHVSSFYEYSNFKDKDAIALYDSLQISNYDSLKALGEVE